MSRANDRRFVQGCDSGVSKGVLSWQRRRPYAATAVRRHFNRSASPGATLPKGRLAAAVLTDFLRSEPTWTAQQAFEAAREAIGSLDADVFETAEALFATSPSAWGAIENAEALEAPSPRMTVLRA